MLADWLNESLIDIELDKDKRWLSSRFFSFSDIETLFDKESDVERAIASDSLIDADMLGDNDFEMDSDSLTL